MNHHRRDAGYTAVSNAKKSVARLQKANRLRHWVWAFGGNQVGCDHSEGARRWLCIVRVVGFGAALATLVGGGQALASAGCDAVNAGNANIASPVNGTDSGPTAFGAFLPGDVITVTVTGGSVAVIHVVTTGANAANREVIFFIGPGGSASGTMIAGDHELALSPYVGASNLTATATCTPAAASSSNKVRALQIAASKLVAQNSGAAISGAVDGAINDAFGDGGSPVTVGPNGVRFNFAAEPAASNMVRQAHDSFAALAYAGNPMVTKTPPGPVVERTWSAWADVRGTGFDRNIVGADLNGTQLNATAGVGRKLTPDILVGMLGGYENFHYTSEALFGTFKGDGATVGGYAAWRIAPALRWDTTLAWSRLWYDAAAGTAGGTFTGSRWLGSTGLNGSYRLAEFVAEPSLKVFALREHQDAWTDSLGTLQASRDFTAGRVSAGGKLVRPWQVAADMTMSPYVGAYADWYFSTDNALPAGQPLVGIADGWSGRVTGGVAVAKRGGGTLSLGGEYSGLGANYKMWTANARVLWPF